MSGDTEHRDYGGSSGTGITSNFQSQTTKGNAGPGPKDHQALDERILSDINERLAQWSEVNVSHLSIEVHDRSVTLKGTMDSSQNVQKVKDLVRQIPGVKNVDSQMQVR